MRTIKDLHNKHKNQAVWIAGSDPTLGNYPDNFFDDKVGITLHMSHVKFPNASYRYANEPDRVEYLSKEYPNYLHQDNIFAYPLYWKSKKYTRELVKPGNPFYLKLRPYPPFGIRGIISRKFTFKKVKQAHMGKSIIYGGHRTCLHGAMYAAIMLGCNELNLIGCGHGMVKSKQEHFGDVEAIDKEMRPDEPSFSDPTNNVPMITQTLAIIDACESLGIKVNWYRDYSPEMDQKHEIDRDELKKQWKFVQWEKINLKRLIRFCLMPLNWIINSF